MADRVSQVVGQALLATQNPKARVSQIVAQALQAGGNPNARVTQIVAQVLTKPVAGNNYVSTSKGSLLRVGNSVT